MGPLKGMQRGGKTSRNRGHNSSLDHALNPIASPMGSICESYKNIEFFAVKEPYMVAKNKFYRDA